MIFDSILGTVGNTPTVRLERLEPEGVQLYAKVEALNPLGSVKDRLALGVIEHAERAGHLEPGQTVVEATSGNTGIGLAMVCARKGYPLVVTMAENFSIERRRLLRFLGAKVVLTPAALKATGMLAKAKELADAHGWFLCRQFENDANAEMHMRTTGPEILRDFADRSLDYWVTGFGTGGTLKGVASVLRERSPKTRIVVCEPDNAAILASGVDQKREADGSPAERHPSFRPHLMQGWTPDFIPKLTADAAAAGAIDEFLAVSGADAMAKCRELAQKEGVFVGISAGATLAGALEVARRAPEGANVLCMLPDTGERYLSTPLFEDVPVDMTPEEDAIAKSTPNYRFDVKLPSPAAAGGEAPELDASAERYFDEAVADTDQPLTVFALEWCEFCWSVRKLFGKLGARYRSVDLDSVAYQEGDFGGKIRAVLKQREGLPTVPQVYVGGRHIGGATETFEAYKSGELQRLLSESGVAYDDRADFDPYSLLPGWLHPR